MPKSRKESKLTNDERAAYEAIKTDYEGEYVLHSGDTYGGRKNSLRYRSFETVRPEAGKPVSVATFLGRTRNIGGKDIGFPIPLVLGGVALHSGSKKTVFLRLRKNSDGDFVNVSEITNPSPKFGLGTDTLPEGTVIVKGTRAKVLKGKGKSASK